MLKKCFIKLPNYVNAFYSAEKKIIVFKGPRLMKTLKLDLQLSINKKTSIIRVNSIPFFKISNSKKKRIKSYQGLISALIKQSIKETCILFYQKLKFVGVGYRAFFVEHSKKQLLMIKVGYSHTIYFKKPIGINVFCLKTTKLFLYGNSYQQITQISSFFRSYRKPELYKGKGILYDTEKIILKEGKKT